MACNTGFYTQLLKQQAATTVVGVNISEEMLKVTRKQKKEKPLGIQYHLENTTQLEQIESFDLII
ncbi:MAG: class I SAM-dependent methyltransferase [Trichodesmium sp. MAG_R01]|nr:class I SAM-dependent methyltransferase [Trichodesmium sp. MAG_R01]